jgi:hypothetical protein
MAGQNEGGSMTDTSNGGAANDARETDESPKERIDRELIELLNELRVALSGTTVLFAFLLTIPFSQRFAQVSELQQSVYFGTFLLAAVTTALLMAPTAYHRLRFRDRDKEQLLRTANILAIAGIVSLTAAMGGAVFLITDVLYGSWVAALVSGVVTAFVALWWFVLPLSRKAQE